WRLGNAGVDVRRSILEKFDLDTNFSMNELINKPDIGFPRFPELISGRSQGISIPAMEVKVEPLLQPIKAKLQRPPLSRSLFILYSKTDTTVIIKPLSVHHDVSFAAFQIKDLGGQIVGEWVMEEGKEIAVKIKKRKPYYIYMTPRNNVSYRLLIRDA